MIPMFLANAAIALNMQWSRLTVRAPFLKALRYVEASQGALLRQIMRENADTDFGRSHGFASITTFDAYRARVPVSTYDTLETHVLAQQSGTPALTAEPPVYYARTSGTTGRYKDIPLTRHGVAQIGHVQKQLALSLWQQTGFFEGVVMGFSSPGYEGYLPNGIPYGSTSGATYQSLSPILESKFGIPREAFSLDDVEAKYEVYALTALARDQVSGVVTVNPSSLLKVCTMIEDQREGLLRAIVNGDDSALRAGSKALLPTLRKALSPARAAVLTALLEDSTAPATPALLWPRLTTLVTWTGGSCGIALDRLKALLPETVKVVEMGYASSEFIGTANIDVDRSRCLPLLTDNVYEFVAKEDWERGSGAFLGLHEIQPGAEYYVFITNRSGLYRYDINDVVRATEGLHGCPGLAFVRKGKGVTNITGEKLSEDQVIAAVSATLEASGTPAESFMALADEQAAHYRLYLELPSAVDLSGKATEIDQQLRNRNGEYDDKRASGRLQPVTVARLRGGAGAALKAKRVADGVRETQYKPPVLAYWSEWEAWLNAWVESA